jgi:hypothetical protein
MHSYAFTLLLAFTASSLHAAEPTRIEECLTESDLVLVAAHIEPLVASGLIAESAEASPEWLQSLTRQNVATVYLTVDLLNAMPAIFIPIPEGADDAAVAELQDAGRELGGLLDLTTDRNEPLGAFVFVGAASKRERILSEPAVERAGLAAALAASNDSRISVILAWTPEQQRVLREIFPTLPPELGSIDGQILSEQVHSLRLSVLSESDAIQLEINADVAATAEQMGSAMEGWLQYAVSNSGNEIAANMVLGMFNFSRETEDGTCRLRWTLRMPADQLRPLAQQWFAAATGGVDAINNLKQIGLAMHNFHETYGSFPPSASYVDGQPLLSWRVYLLPYLGYAPLYEKFHLDEPWDSEHNLTLLAEMPDVYSSPNRDLNEQGLTRFVVPVAETTAFHGETGVPFQDITDGTAQTALVVAVPAEHAVPWTKPVDWEVDFTTDLHGWLFEAQGAPILMGDGSVQRFDAEFSPENLTRLLQHQDGEPIE